MINFNCFLQFFLCLIGRNLFSLSEMIVGSFFVQKTIRIEKVNLLHNYREFQCQHNRDI